MSATSRSLVRLGLYWIFAALLFVLYEAAVVNARVAPGRLMKSVREYRSRVVR